MTNIIHIQYENIINIYPNPFNDILNVDYVQILNVNGVLMLKTENNKIDVSDLSSGTYILEINNKNNIVRKLIFKK